MIEPEIEIIDKNGLSSFMEVSNLTSKFLGKAKNVDVDEFTNQPPLGSGGQWSQALRKEIHFYEMRLNVRNFKIVFMHASNACLFLLGMCSCLLAEILGMRLYS